MTDRAEPDIPEELPEDSKSFLFACLKYDMRERATLQQLKQHPFITNAVLSQNASNISDSKSAAIRKRNPKDITDKITELRLLKEGFPNPAKIGKKNKLDPHIYSIKESSFESKLPRDKSDIKQTMNGVNPDLFQ